MTLNGGEAMSLSTWPIGMTRSDEQPWKLVEMD